MCADGEKKKKRSHFPGVGQLLLFIPKRLFLIFMTRCYLLIQALTC